MIGPGRSRPTGRGFTYLGVIFLVGLLTLTGTVAAVAAATVQRRESEQQLVFVGKQFAAALQRYSQAQPGHAKRYPTRLEELLQDDRAPGIERHLRRLYADPMTGRAEWGLVRQPGGGIVGVYSLSDRKPFDRRQVGADFLVPSTASYREWRFLAQGAPAGAGSASDPASGD